MYTKSSLSLFYGKPQNVFKETVYHSWCDWHTNDAGIEGSTCFLDNLRKIKFTNSDPNLETLMCQAQRDIVEKIPYGNNFSRDKQLPSSSSSTKPSEPRIKDQLIIKELAQQIRK